MEEIRLTHDLYKQATAEEITLSQLLEKMDPTPEGGKLDAFERQLRRFGIVTKSIPERGINASRVEEFYRTDESRVLFPEFIARTAREAMMEESILPYLVGVTETIDSNAYRTIYVADQPEAQRKKRVTEGAELPKAKLVTSDQTLKIYKYGRAIEASYETIRRMKIDLLAIHVRRIAGQAANDKVEEIITVVKDGDGNNNAATQYKNKTLDPNATAGTLSRKAFLSFLLKLRPYKCNTILASEDGLLQVLDLTFPDSDTTQMLAFLLGGASLSTSIRMPQGLFADFTLLYNDAVPKLNNHPAIIGLDQRYAIEEVVEAGSDIQEADKYILNQTQVLTVSENSGFGKIMTPASAMLEID